MWTATGRRGGSGLPSAPWGLLHLRHRCCCCLGAPPQPAPAAPTPHLASLPKPAHPVLDFPSFQRAGRAAPHFQIRSDPSCRARWQSDRCRSALAAKRGEPPLRGLPCSALSWTSAEASHGKHTRRRLPGRRTHSRLGMYSNRFLRGHVLREISGAVECCYPTNLNPPCERHVLYAKSGGWI